MFDKHFQKIKVGQKAMARCLGTVSEVEIYDIEDGVVYFMLTNPKPFQIPSWRFNRAECQSYLTIISQPQLSKKEDSGITPEYQSFFEFMKQEHDLILTKSEVHEILFEADKLIKTFKQNE